MRRLPKEMLSSRKIMLEYLRQLKVAAMEAQDERSSELVDTTKKLWESMLPDDESHAKVANDVAGIMSTSVSILHQVSELIDRLGHLPDISAFATEFDRLKQQLAVVLAENDDLKRKHAKGDEFAKATKARLEELNLKMDQLKEEGDPEEPAAVLQSMDIFDQLHHKLDRAIAAKARQSRVCDALRGDLAEVNREVERLKRVCNDLREATTPMTREIEFLKKSLEDTCKDLENANRDKKELEARNGALSNEIYQLQHMLDSVREQKDHTTSTQLDFWPMAGAERPADDGAWEGEVEEEEVVVVVQPRAIRRQRPPIGFNLKHNLAIRTRKVLCCPPIGFNLIGFNLRPTSSRNSRAAWRPRKNNSSRPRCDFPGRRRSCGGSWAR